MEQQNNKKTVIVVVLIIIILVLAFISYRLLRAGSEEEAARQAILEAEANKLNPFNQGEVTNPFEGSSNPYENIKTNPFE